MRIHIHEHFFDDDIIGLVMRDDRLNVLGNRQQPFWQRLFFIGFDAAARDVGEFVAGDLNDAKARDAQTRIDAEDEARGVIQQRAILKIGSKP